MKATIFKNDNFETVGLKVEHADITLFSWGSTAEQFYYTKTVDADKYTWSILDLIKCQRMIQYYEFDFTREVLEINCDTRNMAKRKDETDNGTFIDLDKERVAELEKRIEQIIATIK